MFARFSVDMDEARPQVCLSECTKEGISNINSEPVFAKSANSCEPQTHRSALDSGIQQQDVGDLRTGLDVPLTRAVTASTFPLPLPCVCVC